MFLNVMFIFMTMITRFMLSNIVVLTNNNTIHLPALSCVNMKS